MDVSIRDVSPRDGLQGEQSATPEQRAELVAKLIGAGVRDIEVAAFVSPTAVPAMAGAAEVFDAAEQAASGSDAVLWSLVPNTRGAELAFAAGVRFLTVTISASPSYSEQNTQMTLDAAKAQLVEICDEFSDALIDVVVSCAFGSPYPGESVTPGAVGDLVAFTREIAGVDHVTLADTTGVATPRRVSAVLDRTGVDVGLHLHDTRATALVNAWHALECGVRRFDTALGGLGGSPFAPAAGGNLATEDLVLVLNDVGFATGIDLDALLAAGPYLAGLVGHGLPSRVAAAGRLDP